MLTRDAGKALDLCNALDRHALLIPAPYGRLVETKLISQGRNVQPFLCQQRFQAVRVHSQY